MKENLNDSPRAGVTYRSGTARHGAISAIATTSVANTAAAASAVTTGYNSQCQGFIDRFNAVRISDAQTLNLTETNSAARNRGVYRGWEYEKADVLMGGRGSANWNDQECQDIIDRVIFDDQNKSRSGVRGAEGHHQKNAANHPELQADPDNIKFYRNRKEHLEKGHNGSWQNETDADLINKNKMLRRTNSRRVIRNELKGLGIAVAIGAGVGMTVSFIAVLAQQGLSLDSLKLALADGAKGGLESGLLSAVGYGIGRTVGDLATNAVTGVLGNLGMTITDNITAMAGMGVVGAITIAVFSAYQFAKLKYHGVSTGDALIQTGKQALFSVSVLTVSILAQGIWGGAAGIIVSAAIGAIMLAYSIVQSRRQRALNEKLAAYAIEYGRPTF